MVKPLTNHVKLNMCSLLISEDPDEPSCSYREVVCCNAIDHNNQVGIVAFCTAMRKCPYQNPVEIKANNMTFIALV